MGNLEAAANPQSVTLFLRDFIPTTGSRKGHSTNTGSIGVGDNQINYCTTITLARDTSGFIIAQQPLKLQLPIDEQHFAEIDLEANIEDSVEIAKNMVDQRLVSYLADWYSWAMSQPVLLNGPNFIKQFIFEDRLITPRMLESGFDPEHLEYAVKTGFGALVSQNDKQELLSYLEQQRRERFFSRLFNPDRTV